MTFPAFTKRVGDLCCTGARLGVRPIKPFEIVRVDAVNIRYRRGHSIFAVALKDLYAATVHFSGRRASSADLRLFRPNVFDPRARPAGHSCHVSVLFTVLLLSGLAEALEGRGVVGSPYSIFIR